MSRFPPALRSVAAAGLLFLPAAAAAAAEEATALAMPSNGERPVPALSWTRTAGFASDYNYRGVTLTDRGPAAQAGLAVTHRSGLYASADGSTVRFAGTRDVELAARAGWAGAAGAFGEIDASLSYTAYARFAAPDMVEASLGWRLPLGPITPFAGVDYAPAQTPLRGAGERLASNLYLHGGAEWAVRGTPLTVRGEAGRERGAMVPLGGSKWDWQVGAAIALGKAEIGLAYHDTALDRADPDLARAGKRGLVVSASAGF